MTVAELIARCAEAVKDEDAARAQAKVNAICDEGYAFMAREASSKRETDMRVPDLLS